MTETKHTPGPWRSSEADADVRGPGGVEVAFAYSAGGYEEQEANIALIAAAPDLLAACEAAMEWEGDQTGPGLYTEVRSLLELAINKARRET